MIRQFKKCEPTISIPDFMFLLLLKVSRWTAPVINDLEQARRRWILCSLLLHGWHFVLLTVGHSNNGRFYDVEFSRLSMVDELERNKMIWPGLLLGYKDAFAALSSLLYFLRKEQKRFTMKVSKIFTYYNCGKLWEKALGYRQ